MKKSSMLSTLAIAYLMIGFVVAALFALYYRWTPLSFLSPGFYSVILTWPYQIIGFAADFWTYGFAGKPLTP